MNANGGQVSEPRDGIFEMVGSDPPGIFDQFFVGQDGYLYYYQQSDGFFFQMDEYGEVYNHYDDLVEVFTLRGGMLVDKEGQVLLGGNSAVEVYGAKEALVHELELEKTGFVSDLKFADNGQLVVLQPDTVSVLQYGARDEDTDE